MQPRGSTATMPAMVYRWYSRAHSARRLERYPLGFVGSGPLHGTLIGMIDTPDPKARKRWPQRMRKLGARAL